MPSSTFVSKPNTTRAICVLLAGLFLYFCALETITRAGFTNISSIQRRIREDRNKALKMRPTLPDGRKMVLLVGNSLLLEGLQPDKLKKEMEAQLDVQVLPIENTQYLDWYFGIRRLFGEGARPALIVLCLSPQQLISAGTDGEYFAHYMMQLRDILLVKKEGRLDLTKASNYFFANQSAWLGSRSEIRNWLLEKVLPNTEDLTAYLPERAGISPAENVVVEASLQHLMRMQQLCNDYGAAFVFLIPPSLELDNDAEAILTAGTRLGIRVLLTYGTR